MITPLPGASSCKPRSATLPFLGVAPVLVDEEGRAVPGNGVSGNLCVAQPWPGQARTPWAATADFRKRVIRDSPGLVSHDLKGTGSCAFVTVKPAFEHTPPGQMVGALEEQVRRVIAPLATPVVRIVPGLPKTRSGKLLLRMLGKIAAGDVADLGDTTTLADPSVLAAPIPTQPEVRP